MSILECVDRSRNKRRGVVTRYALFLGGADLDKRSSNETFAPQMYERYAAWMRSLRESGHYVASHKLEDQIGVRLTVRGGQVSEGPFMETKEAVGGVYFLNAGSLDEVVGLARSCPILDLQNGYVEIRVIDEEVPAGVI
jgi:hypothetical protein